MKTPSPGEKAGALPLKRKSMGKVRQMFHSLQTLRSKKNKRKGNSHSHSKRKPRVKTYSFAGLSGPFTASSAIWRRYSIRSLMRNSRPFRVGV